MIFFSCNCFCKAFQSSSCLANTFILCLTFCFGILCKDWCKIMSFVIDLVLNNLFRYFAAVAFLLKKYTRSLGILFVGRSAKSSLVNKCSCISWTGTSNSWPKSCSLLHFSNVAFDTWPSEGDLFLMLEVQ